MPHDRNGAKLRVGDLVMIPAIITGLDSHEEFCNLALETIEPMYPGPNKTPLVLNTKQIQLIKRLGDSATDVNVSQAMEDSRLMRIEELNPEKS